MIQWIEETGEVTPELFNEILKKRKMENQTENLKEAQEKASQEEIEKTAKDKTEDELTEEEKKKRGMTDDLAMKILRGEVKPGDAFKKEE